MMKHLEASFTEANIPFNHEGNRVRQVVSPQINPVSAHLFPTIFSCFPHIINLAVQAIYAALKDGKGLEGQYLLGNIDCFGRASVEGADLPEGVTKTGYINALKADILGDVRKLVGACRVSGKRREELENTILEGNQNKIWTNDQGEPVLTKILQLLRDCEIRWSSTHLMVDRVLEMLPVCGDSTDLKLRCTQTILDHQSICWSAKSI